MVKSVSRCCRAPTAKRTLLSRRDQLAKLSRKVFSDELAEILQGLGRRGRTKISPPWLNLRKKIEQSNTAGALFKNSRFQDLAPHEVMWFIIEQDPELACLVDQQPVMAKLLAPLFVGHYQAIAQMANPDNRALVGISAAAGAAAADFFLSTNAEYGIFVDHAYGWEKMRGKGYFIFNRQLKIGGQKYVRGFASCNDEIGLFIKAYSPETFGPYQKYLPYFDALLIELAALGVTLEELSRLRTQEEEYYRHYGNISLEFNWAHPAEPEQKKKRQINLINADITKPVGYPEQLNILLERGIDFYYERASLGIPLIYRDFLPIILKYLKTKGKIIIDNYLYFVEMPDLASFFGVKPFPLSEEFLAWNSIFQKLLQLTSTQKSFTSQPSKLIGGNLIWETGIYQKP